MPSLPEGLQVIGQASGASTIHVPSTIPLNRNANVAPGFSWFLIVSLLLIGLFCVSYLRWKKKRPSMSFFKSKERPHTIKFIESRTLSRRSSLHVIEFEGKRILLGESDAGISQITEVTVAAPDCSGAVDAMQS